MYQPNLCIFMNVSKTLLQAIAVALTVTTVSSSCGEILKPKKKEPEKEQQPYNCPGCGMG
jgi:predicted RNA-binding Zn-ribbon protein involved in translation (DUF1610 family)